ncbi:MAG: hypothetical protein LCH58_16000 [Bacteroidetes bacterium]|jgi:hypothetical protein|uniref:hypothetical protein n=1 Tax=Phnomibacter sp. TaxID=2836217 RepID=UPI002FDE8A85|nr:hypothetical protein [Bacteroidota bacterium]
MAKQKGIIPIEGTLGNITFYRSKEGYLIREKGGVSKSRISTDPAFQRTRENGAEFGRAGTSGKLIRTAFREMLLNVSDSKMVSRLTQVLMQVIKADTVSERGLRKVNGPNLIFLKGFDFNVNGKLATTLFAPYSAEINRSSGQLEITIPPFSAANMIAAPAGATHFRLIAGGAAIDFEGNTYDAANTGTTHLPLSGADTAEITLNCTITAASTKPLLLLFGLEFYQMVNDAQYSLKNGAFNCLSVIDISGE